MDSNKSDCKIQFILIIDLLAFVVKESPRQVWMDECTPGSITTPEDIDAYDELTFVGSVGVVNDSHEKSNASFPNLDKS